MGIGVATVVAKPSIWWRDPFLLLLLLLLEKKAFGVGRFVFSALFQPNLMKLASLVDFFMLFLVVKSDFNLDFWLLSYKHFYSGNLRSWEMMSRLFIYTVYSIFSHALRFFKKIAAMFYFFVTLLVFELNAFFFNFLEIVF